MRQGNFELLIMGEGDVPHQEHLVGGKPCVQAEPGREYHVKINIYRGQAGQFPAKYLRFGLYVDGYDVQYWKRIDLSNEKLLPTDPLEPVCSKFWGFKKNVNDLRSFVFSVPSTITDTRALTSDQTSLGVVKLVVYEAEVSSGVYANQDGYFEAPAQQEIGETTKFWKQASVTTSAGKKVVSEKEKFAPLPRWSNKSTVPMETLTLQYHTSAMIEFLQEFQHKLHDSTNNKSNSSLCASSSSGGGGAVSSGSNGARYRVHRSATGQDVLDLTADSSGDEGDEGTERAGAAAEHSLCDTTSYAVGGGSGRGGANIGTEDGSGNSGVSGDLSAQAQSNDEQAAKRQRILGSEEEEEEEGVLSTEVPIDEDISFVLRKKIVPYLDLSEEVAAGQGTWSSVLT